MYHRVFPDAAPASCDVSLRARYDPRSSVTRCARRALRMRYSRARTPPAAVTYVSHCWSVAESSEKCHWRRRAHSRLQNQRPSLQSHEHIGAVPGSRSASSGHSAWQARSSSKQSSMQRCLMPAPSLIDATVDKMAAATTAANSCGKRQNDYVTKVYRVLNTAC